MSKVVTIVVYVVYVCILLISIFYSPKLLSNFKTKALTAATDANGQLVDISATLGDYWIIPCMVCTMMLLAIGSSFLQSCESAASSE